MSASIRPLEVFRTLQLGAFPAPAITRRFLEANFSKELMERNITPTKLQALEPQSCNMLLKQLFQAKFLSVPCRIITFDVEFSGLPTFTNDGPSEDIIELGAFCPIRGKVFSRLVTTKKTIPEAVVKLTGIDNALLEKEGVPFEKAWQDFMDFIETDEVALLEGGGEGTGADAESLWAAKPNADEAKKDEGKEKGEKDSSGKDGGDKNEEKGEKKKQKKSRLPTFEINAQAEKTIWYDPVDIIRVPDTLTPMTPAATPGAFKPKALLLSHGGKLADIAMIEWALKRSGQTLPAHYKFADTYNIIQDLHQRRPVTQDKHPPSYRLAEMCNWLKTKVPATIHRAGPDAAMTWQALFHTLDRYGDESRTPHQQLMLRYFEADAVMLMSEADDPSSSRARTQQAMGATDFGFGDDGLIGAGAGAATTVEDDMSILDLDLDSILK